MQPELTSPSLRNRLVGAIGIVALAASLGLAANGTVASPFRVVVNESSAPGCSTTNSHQVTPTATASATNPNRSTIR